MNLKDRGSRGASALDWDKNLAHVGILVQPAFCTCISLAFLYHIYQAHSHNLTSPQAKHADWPVCPWYEIIFIHVNMTYVQIHVCKALNFTVHVVWEDLTCVLPLLLPSSTEQWAGKKHHTVNKASSRGAYEHDPFWSVFEEHRLDSTTTDITMALFIL